MSGSETLAVVSTSYCCFNLLAFKAVKQCCVKLVCEANIRSCREELPLFPAVCHYWVQRDSCAAPNNKLLLTTITTTTDDCWYFIHNLDIGQKIST